MPLQRNMVDFFSYVSFGHFGRFFAKGAILPPVCALFLVNLGAFECILMKYEDANMT